MALGVLTARACSTSSRPGKLTIISGTVLAVGLLKALPTHSPPRREPSPMTRTSPTVAATLALVAGLSLSAFAGTGSTVSFAAPSSFMLSDDGPRDAVVVDVDEDGHLDVAYTMSGAAGGHSALYIVRGDGSGIFDDDAEITITAPQALTAGDFNEDGHVDFAVLGRQYSGAIKVQIILGDGTGGLSYGVTFTPFSASSFPQDTVTGDFNEDGHLDLAFSGTSILVTYLGTGDGGFTADQSHSLSAARQIMVGDLDLDGHTDLLTGSKTLLGAGDGSFTEVTAPNANVAALGDMNEDGIPDLIGATSLLLHYEGNGDGTFTLNSTTPLGASANAIELADIDADGHLDVVTLLNNLSFSVTLGLGDGTVCPPQPIPITFFPNSVLTVADLSEDGLPDVIIPVTVSDESWTRALVNTTTTSPWTDLGFGLAGTSGTPVLEGTGSLQGGSSGSLDLTAAAPSATAVLFTSVASTPTPFKGGTLVTIPISALFTLTTGAAGDIPLPFVWPAGIPAGSELYFQYGIADPGAVVNVALSNGVRAVTP